MRNYRIHKVEPFQRKSVKRAISNQNFHFNTSSNPQNMGFLKISILGLSFWAAIAPALAVSNSVCAIIVQCAVFVHVTRQNPCVVSSQIQIYNPKILTPDRIIWIFTS